MMTVRLRHIALIMMTALAMGCSQDDGDVPGGNGELPSQTLPISFFGAMQDEQSVTRAALKDEGVVTFTVFGFKNDAMEGDDNYTSYQTVFPGYTVNWLAGSAATTPSNSNGWEYVAQELLGQDEQTVKYWDWAAKAYRFFGVTKTFDELNGKIIGDAYKLSFKVDLTTDEGIADVPYYSHLWFSNNNYDDYRTRQYGQPVELEFLKPACKVRIMFIYEASTDNRINTPLTEISFHRTDDVTIKQKGDVTISYPLKGTATAETCAFDTEASGIVGFSRDYREQDPFWYTVIPVTNQGTYTLDVIVDGDPKTTIVPAEYMDWKPGYKYTYIFKIHVDGSVAIDAVQSAFTGWKINESNHTVYNW